jgi:predicted Zn-dependent protease
LRLASLIVLALLVLLLFGGRLLPLLGRLGGDRARKPMRQAKWVWATLGGSEEDVAKAEEEFGEECAREFDAQFRGPVDQRLEAFVNSVGERLAGAALHKRRFTFRVVSAASPNAFALPGGFIFVTDGLMALSGCQPDEVALLLSHEMAHAALGHSRSKLMVDQVLNLLTARAAAAGQLARTLLSKGYSREQEFEADEAGMRLAVRAGFDRERGANLLRRLLERTPEEGPLAEFFATHPPLEERIARIMRA